MGHTHHQLHIRKNGKTLINPGSVGQPRSGRKGAQWCIFDTKLMKVDFITKTYDAAPFLQRVIKVWRKCLLLPNAEVESLE